MRYNFTLIIPTHNRHDYLKRSIEYYKDAKVQVFYCDSTLKEFKGKSYPHIKYFHLPEVKFANKINQALKKVDTKFVALCADDDFVLLTSLYKGCNYLSNHKDYKMFTGRIINFHEKFDGDFYNGEVLPQSLNDTPNVNASLFFKDYYQVLWGMYDKEILVKSFEIIGKASYQNDNFIELTIGGVACYLGGIKFDDVIWGVREWTINEHWGNRHKVLSNIYNDKNIEEDFKCFKMLLDNVTASGYSDLVLNSYINISLCKKYIKRIKGMFKRIIPLSLHSKLMTNDSSTNGYVNNYTALNSSRVEDINDIELEKIKTILVENGKYN